MRVTTMLDARRDFVVSIFVAMQVGVVNGKAVGVQVFFKEFSDLTPEFILETTKRMKKAGYWTWRESEGGIAIFPTDSMVEIMKEEPIPLTEDQTKVIPSEYQEILVKDEEVEET